MNTPRPALTSTKLHENVLATAAGGMAIALASVLSLIKLFGMPQGGTVTPASMLPILFVALAFGPGWGIGIGAVYGLLQFVLEPFAAHWASVILDYPLAFSLLGLAGLFARPKAERTAERQILRRISAIGWPQIVAGVGLGMLGRTVSHLLSGVIFYGSYAQEAGQNPWIYSLVYNLSYMIPEALITLLILIPLAVTLRGRQTAPLAATTRDPRDTTRLVAYGGMMAALVLVVTRFSAMPILNGQGYLNLGDATILFAAALLGPAAVIPAALGSAMADIWAGYVQYAPATLVIKGLVALVASLFLHKAGATLVRKISGLILAELVMVAGYFLFEIFLLGLPTALFDVMFNMIQAGVCAIVGLALLPVADRIRKTVRI